MKNFSLFHMHTADLVKRYMAYNINVVVGVKFQHTFMLKFHSFLQNVSMRVTPVNSNESFIFILVHAAQRNKEDSKKEIETIYGMFHITTANVSE